MVQEKANTSEAKVVLDEMRQIMSDPKRRALYDITRSSSYHETSKQPGKTHHTPGMHSVIKQYIPKETLQRFPDIWSRQQKSKDVTHSLKCTLEEFYNGKVIKLKIQRQMPCEACKGVGYSADTATNQLIPCGTCGAKRVERRPNILEFKLLPGVRNGYRKRLKAQVSIDFAYLSVFLFRVTTFRKWCQVIFIWLLSRSHMNFILEWAPT